MNLVLPLIVIGVIALAIIISSLPLYFAIKMFGGEVSILKVFFVNTILAIISFVLVYFYGLSTLLILLVTVLFYSLFFKINPIKARMTAETIIYKGNMGS